MKIKSYTELKEKAIQIASLEIEIAITEAKIQALIERIEEMKYEYTKTIKDYQEDWKETFKKQNNEETRD